MGKQKELTTSWRRLAIATYAAPKDSRIYGTFDVDVTEVLKYIEVKKQAGIRMTITHFMAAALARTLYEDVPEINCFVRRGHVVARRNANVFITINVSGSGMTGMVLRKCQELSVSKIGEIIRKESENKRAGNETGAFAAKDAVANIPWPFRRPIFLFIKWWIFDMGLSFPFLKIPPDPFGSIMLTNIGTFGLQYGFPALFPIGKLPCVIAMGTLTKKPVVIDNEVKIRDILPIAGTFDHRIVDGYQGGVLAGGVIRRLQNPDELDRPNLPQNNPELPDRDVE
ncbi:MAG: 2-oxo acid dehydrogenase subunit E2 [Candidatus Neomarinimicrobiota bacterium]